MFFERPTIDYFCFIKLTGKGNNDVMIINFEIDPFKTSRSSSAAVKVSLFYLMYKRFKIRF